MSNNASLFPLAAAGLTAFALAAAIFVSSNLAHAAERGAEPRCLCPSATSRNPTQNPTWSKFAEPSATLDRSDEYAALASVQLALTEIADGASYIWRRHNGRLSGLVKPLSSFKDTKGAVCRHAVVVLSSVTETKRTEIVACRLPTGIWELAS
jgi:hypothetical protein